MIFFLFQTMSFNSLVSTPPPFPPFKQKLTYQIQVLSIEKKRSLDDLCYWQFVCSTILPLKGFVLFDPVCLRTFFMKYDLLYVYAFFAAFLRVSLNPHLVSSLF